MQNLFPSYFLRLLLEIIWHRQHEKEDGILAPHFSEKRSVIDQVGLNGWAAALVEYWNPYQLGKGFGI